MRTVVPGIIKIGKTTNDNFETRMRNLEGNGYANVAGLKREFAIEVDSYDEKEKLIHNIFSKSRIGGTELFALDLEIVKSLLSSLEGKQIFPKDESKKEIFEKSFQEIEIKSEMSIIPNGEYVINRKIKGFGNVAGKARMEDGIFKVLKGSICANSNYEPAIKLRKEAKIENNILLEDVTCKSLSAAAILVTGNSCNGWTEWKDLSGKTIDYICRRK